ncbi:helix-turn-helix domain-containing protein [Peptostreptococcus equinus]|uniref:Helix-turn-helix transcriptional regulator n=1 Tax=Peptostreptococcus equinus TaxID=3003601 RepID=A0ABY7JN19_9FIRM|nr:helix-turn-helix transcriptional regulator [Peptostreptococcus sp. CBA3647]WAW14770.1 helix-turn-helix transcriptional regulator [Peptostreptococcus sp. CBA3647]
MENIYKKYRKASGLTQEVASEKLGISVDSLKRYEMGERIPSNDIAKNMCTTYKDMRLAYDHVCNSEVGKLLLENLVGKDLCCSVLNFINILNNNVVMKDTMIKIASDGVIDCDEIDEWQEAEAAIKSLITSGYEILLRRDKFEQNKNKTCSSNA